VDKNQAGLLNYVQVAEMLNIPKGTIYSWVSTKRIPHIRLSPRCVRFSADDLTTWLSERQVNPQNHYGFDLTCIRKTRNK
jgi:excisionase family DNA binding protein